MTAHPKRPLDLHRLNRYLKVLEDPTQIEHGLNYFRKTFNEEISQNMVSSMSRGNEFAASMIRHYLTEEQTSPLDAETLAYGIEIIFTALMSASKEVSIVNHFGQAIKGLISKLVPIGLTIALGKEPEFGIGPSSPTSGQASKD